MNKSANIVEVKDLKTWFPIRHGVLARTVGHVRAVDGVSFFVARGETLGLVGESGCGKSTLGRTLMGLEKIYAGEVLVEGKSLAALSGRQLRSLRRRIQIVFQDPLSSLNPRMNTLDIVTEGMIQFGLLDGDREAVAGKLMAEVGLSADMIYRYPHEFSGGQRQRINIARAVSLKPDFIVCDEPVSALDVSVQAQIINLLLDLRKKYGLAYLFISHDLSVVSHISHRVAVMYLGKIVEYGRTAAVIQQPRHPYTRALVDAIPVPGSHRREKIVLSGSMPSPANPPPGCPFHPRCPEAMAVCRTRYPAESGDEERRVRCHLY
ncbi:MAG: ABC transporter ATP-binding protein [Deltaproteobacteria bacterium]|jgi:oligopeptide/dipeptide ABC transporter ATP-binding protein|nr:ABC transporter ATP-binding protein [Deltaproteobacteria bacterium]